MYHFRTNPPSRQIAPAPLRVSEFADDHLALGANALRRIERFLADTGMKPTRFGRECCNELALVLRLRKGGRITPYTADRINTFLARKVVGHA